jgi:hypothetical protein
MVGLYNMETEGEAIEIATNCNFGLDGFVIT